MESANTSAESGRREQREEGAAVAAPAPAAEAPSFLRSLNREPNETPTRAPIAASTDTTDIERARPQRLRALALVAVLLVVSGFAVMRYLEMQDGTVRVLPVDEIHQLSPFLLSGYRSDEGRGGVFVGRVDVLRWNDLEPFERAALASLLAERLGVRELQLFDQTRSLRARWVSGDVTLLSENNS
jgi:hypothetical protein